MYCSNCGSSIANDAKFCTECGTKVEKSTSTATKKKDTSKTIKRRRFNSRGHRFTGYEGQKSSNKSNKTDKAFVEGKSPILAMVLSLLIVGAGQFYNGDAKKGLVMLFAGIILGLLTTSALWWVLAFYTAYDAYQVANQDKAPWK